eukprot:jgi/Tetstr1/433848/TSEL_023032.t2
MLRFVPFAVSEFGLLAPLAEAFLVELAKASHTHTGQKIGQLLSAWRRRLSMLINMAHADNVLGGVAAARTARDGARAIVCLVLYCRRAGPEGVKSWRFTKASNDQAHPPVSQEDEEWDMDLDSALVKAVKFLKSLDESRLDESRKREAKDLMLALSNSQTDLLSPDESRMTQALGSYSGMSAHSRNMSVHAVLSLMRQDPESRTSMEIQGSGLDGPADSQDSLLPGSPDGASLSCGDAESLPASLLTGVEYSQVTKSTLHSVGRSFFTNVIHLRSLGVKTPLALVSYAALEELQLIKKLQLDRDKLCVYLLALEERYNKTNPYHNSWHAADVVQRCSAIVANLPLDSNKATYLCILGAVIAAAGHDVDHPGLDNKYVVRKEDPLARRFNDQHVLEHHSTYITLELLRDPRCNFLEGSRVKGQLWSQLKNIIINMILATDMSRHFDLVSKFSARFALVKMGDDAFLNTVAGDITLVLQMALKCADLGGCASRHSTHLFWVKSLEQEFFAQGDLEREEEVPISFLMDRHGDGLMRPANQLAFFDVIVMPLYKLFADTFPVCSPLREQATANWRYWKAKATSAEFSDKILTFDMDAIMDRMSEAQILSTIVDEDDQHALATVHRALSRFASESGVGEIAQPMGLPSHISSKVLVRARRSKLTMLRATADLEQMTADEKARMGELLEEAGAEGKASELSVVSTDDREG